MTYEHIIFVQFGNFDRGPRFFGEISYNFRCKISLTNIILKTICQMYN